MTWIVPFEPTMSDLNSRALSWRTPAMASRDVDCSRTVSADLRFTMPAAWTLPASTGGTCDTTAARQANKSVHFNVVDIRFHTLPTGQADETRSESLGAARFRRQPSSTALSLNRSNRSAVVLVGGTTCVNRESFTAFISAMTFTL